MDDEEGRDEGEVANSRCKMQIRDPLACCAVRAPAKIFSDINSHHLTTPKCHSVENISVSVSLLLLLLETGRNTSCV